MDIVDFLVKLVIVTAVLVVLKLSARVEPEKEVCLR